MQARKSPSDEDDISITSTAPSEPQDEYDVECILSEKLFPTGIMYLVKWADYPIERATWEPEDAFCDPNILLQWNKTKEAISHGKQTPFDLDGWIQKVSEIQEAKAKRQQRRQAKRIRLGIRESPSVVDSEESDDSESGSSLSGFIVGDDEDIEGSPEPRGKKRKQPHLSQSIDKRAGSAAPPPRNFIKPTLHPSVSRKPISQTTKIHFSSSPSTVEKPLPLQRSQSDPSRRQEKAKRPSLTVRTSTQPAPPSRATSSSSHPKEPPTAKSTSESSKGVSKKAIPQTSSNSTFAPPLPQAPALRAGRQLTSSFSDDPTSKPKLFRNLSSKNRYEKSLRRELAPDITQLDLRKPGEWATSHENRPPAAHPPPRPSVYDSLFVEQDTPQHSPVVQNGTPMAASDERPTDHQPYPAQQTVAHVSTRPSFGGSSATETLANRSEASALSPKQDKPTQFHGKAKKSSIVTSNKRFFKRGEALVNIKFGPEGKEIGDVRIGQLTWTTIRQLVMVKSNNRIDLHFKDVCNLDEYGELCARVTPRPLAKPPFTHEPNYKYCNGWVLGYDDTSAALNKLSDYLEEKQLAALWYHPDPNIPIVIVAYPSHSKDWEFLGTCPDVPSARLLVAVRTPLPPMSSLQQIIAQQPLSNHNHNYNPDTDTDIPFLHHEDGETPTAEAAEPAKLNNTVSANLLPAMNQPLDIVAVFREQFGITYDELSTVNGPKKDRHARSFYLYFPNEVDAEFQLTQEFLKRYDMAIFSNRIDGDWEKFVATATSGTILFHQTFIHYENMPKLANLLRNPINVFNISLAKPLKYLDYDAHIQRLFPHGGLILMTEDLILNKPQTALKCLEWFGSYIHRKFPGTWKMFFRPNIQFWLLDLCTSWRDDTLWKMYHMIKSLIPKYPDGHYNTYRRADSPDTLDGLTDDEGQHHPFISPRDIPDYGSRQENDEPLIPKGLTQKERDTDHLVEYFAGYGLVNVEKFRRFVVITTHNPQPRWLKWSHIEVMNPTEFNEKFMKPSMRPSGSKKQSSSSSKLPQQPDRHGAKKISSTRSGATNTTTSQGKPQGQGQGQNHGSPPAWSSPATPVTTTSSMQLPQRQGVVGAPRMPEPETMEE
ncbi:hypothetical protein FQN51_005912 [Onygenales sp. PD_10]|nr:hypothetical protein FQN51_005912 [Onygenales sp. PD_10]